MKLIAKKPCCFEGKKFYIGDEIPSDYVLNPESMEKMGVIAIVGNAQPATVELLIPCEEGDMALEPTLDALQDVFGVLASKAADAEPIIKKMTDNDALILLHLSDSRKSIKDAVEARAKEINVEEAGDQ